MDWFPAMVALMVADLYFLAWPRQAKIALSPNFGEKQYFLGKRIYRLLSSIYEKLFSLEDEQKPINNRAEMFTLTKKCCHVIKFSFEINSN